VEGWSDAGVDDPVRELGRRLLGDHEGAVGLRRAWRSGSNLPPGTLDPRLLAALRTEGLVTDDGDPRGTVRISRWSDLLFVHDPPFLGGEIDPDVVLPPSPTTRTLTRLVVPPAFRRALDVGTGCGVLALLLASQADEVVATDVNPRALRYTELGARLNGITNVVCRRGALFGPVRGERFDLVIGNLPFVLAPRSVYAFRDGDRTGDGRDVSEIAVEGVVDVLDEGGLAQFLVNWSVSDLDAPFAVPVAWLRRTESGGLVLLHSDQTPEAYVRMWAVGSDDDPQEWLSDLRHRGAHRVANGAVMVRRSSGVITARMRVRPTDRGGRQVRRILDASVPDDTRLLASRPRLVTPATLVGGTRFDRPGSVRRWSEVRLDETCGVTVRLPPSTATRVVELIDGTRTGHEVARSSRPADVDEATWTRSILDALRLLLKAGTVELDPASAGEVGSVHQVVVERGIEGDVV
jgi:hypothetical protein